MRLISTLGIAGFITTMLIGLLLAIGWVLNIVTLFRHAADPITTITVLRGIGIFIAPLGGVLGWF